MGRIASTSSVSVGMLAGEVAQHVGEVHAEQVQASAAGHRPVEDPTAAGIDVPHGRPGDEAEPCMAQIPVRPNRSGSGPYRCTTATVAGTPAASASSRTAARSATAAAPGFSSTKGIFAAIS